MEAKQPKTSKGRALLVLNCIILSIGIGIGPLLMRLYFIHGGDRVWFSSWLETSAFPIILLPLTFAFLQRRKINPASKFFLMKPRLFVTSAVIGIITGFDDYLYAYGVGHIPVSTSSLIIASQLAFTAIFAFFLVKQKFTPYSINAVFLLTLGAGVLAMHTSGDRAKGQSTKEYVIGFFMTVVAALLYGFILPLVEFMYVKAKQEITYTLVLEIQMVMGFFATAFCTMGMIINNDFKVIGREAREFELGEATYYVVVIITSLIWQCFYVGAIGVIFCGSSLLSGIIIAVILPVTEILAVIFYRESFEVEKGVSLALSLWGFVSYFYGEIKLHKKKEKQTPETEMPSPPNP